MNKIILYSSNGNSAKKVAEFIFNIFYNNSQILCVNNNLIKAEQLNFSSMILICPTYGDEELQLDMENFLVGSNWNEHRGKFFSVCELGLYRGYAKTSFGAAKIISRYLESKELILKNKILSLDLISLENFSLIEKWSENFYE